MPKAPQNVPRPIGTVTFTDEEVNGNLRDLRFLQRDIKKLQKRIIDLESKAAEAQRWKRLRNFWKRTAISRRNKIHTLQERDVKRNAQLIEKDALLCKNKEQLDFLYDKHLIKDEEIDRLREQVLDENTASKFWQRQYEQVLNGHAAQAPVGFFGRLRRCLPF